MVDFIPMLFSLSLSPLGVVSVPHVLVSIISVNWFYSSHHLITIIINHSAWMYAHPHICMKLTMNHEWFKFGSMESNWLDKCFLNCFRSNRVVTEYVMMMMCDVWCDANHTHVLPIKAATQTIAATYRMYCCCYWMFLF